MKNRRYFYTDPLAAAWMARYFGMVFELPASCPHPWNTPGHKVYWRALAEMDCGGFCIHNAAGNGITALRFSEEMSPLLVHPDSLHLLKVNSETDLTHHGIHRAVCEREAEGENRIFHRNGILFHWPESSESLSA